MLCVKNTEDQLISIQQILIALPYISGYFLRTISKILRNINQDPVQGAFIFHWGKADAK